MKVQLLSINFFFLDFFNFGGFFQKFPFFCVTMYICIVDVYLHLLLKRALDALVFSFRLLPLYI